MRAAAEGARMSLGFVEIEWGRLSSGRPVFCPGQRPPAARQRPPVEGEADRAARGRAIFPSSAPITQTGSNPKCPGTTRHFGNFLCAFIFVSALMHVFTVFRSRTLHVFNREKAREETAADVGNRAKCCVIQPAQLA